MAKPKWAVMVCIDNEDDWMYITEDTGKCDWSLKPVLFDTVNEAFDYSDAWRLPGKEHNVQVVRYVES